MRQRAFREEKERQKTRKEIQRGLQVAAREEAIQGARNTGEVRDRTKDPETAATSPSLPRNLKTAPRAARPRASAIPKAVPITPAQELEATRTRLHQLEADLELQRQELAMGRQQ